MTPEERAHPPTTEEMATAIAYCNRVLGSDWRNQSAFAIAAAIEQARREEMREHRQETGCRLTHRLKTTPWAAIRARAQ